MSRQESQQVGLLFEQHGPRVYRRALRILGHAADAEEATQEIFVRVVRGADAFRGQAQLTTWLYQITTNYCLNVLRDRRRRRELHDAEIAPAAQIRGDSEHGNAHELVLLRRLLSEGDPQQAQAAAYVFLDGMSHEEAAQVLGVSKRTVGNLIERFSTWAQEQEAVSEAKTARAAGDRS